MQIAFNRRYRSFTSGQTEKSLSPRKIEELKRRMLNNFFDVHKFHIFVNEAKFKQGETDAVCNCLVVFFHKYMSVEKCNF